MLLALLSRLSARTANVRSNLTYFFCQSNITGRNTATSILKGLIHLILSERRDLVDSIQRHLNAPKTLSALFDALKDVSTSNSIPSMYVVIDALDECDDQLPELLRCISRESRNPQTKIKWLVSSRNLVAIMESMSFIRNRVNADLELNEPRVSNGVANFIKNKVQELAEAKFFRDEILENVKSTLLKKAEGTFLWVSLACRELEESDPWDIEDVLAEIPSGLEPLYNRMIDKIDQLSSKRDRRTTTLCKSVLILASIARRNLRLDEIPTLAALPEDKFTPVENVKRLVHYCGSFLVIRNTTAYFVHQSARDFLLGIGKQRVFFLGEKPCTEAQIHRDLISRCIGFMSKTLQMDLCQLGGPGATISQSGALIQKNLPPPIRYMSRYWIEHLQAFCERAESTLPVSSCEEVCDFVTRKFLYWMEALILTGETQHATSLLTNLRQLLHVRAP